MNIRFWKYQGAGNDFVIIDNRKMWFDSNNISLIKFLCDRCFGVGSDGLMLLQNHKDYDFEMLYFNSDGPEASMCGNGGRCIVSFAKKLGIIQTNTTFMAVDGLHKAVVESDQQVNLKMIDVSSFENISDDYFLDTGSPHYVRFIEEIDSLDVYSEGRKIRYNDRFKETGTNVNFTKLGKNELTVYTYERGVENETLACGTGITAAALCAAIKTGIDKGEFKVKAKGGNLSVLFEKEGNGFKNVWLKGPATFVFEGEIEVD
ncbi:MAG: diaminopimelate epimerase [Mariniphaga sp.]|nr:diaminopimelate epimerase [Mariniphaga sp.]